MVFSGGRKDKKSWQFKEERKLLSGEKKMRWGLIFYKRKSRKEQRGGWLVSAKNKKKTVLRVLRVLFLGWQKERTKG